MTVSVVTRWTTPDVSASTAIAKRSKALWKKLGALDVRLNQIFTGPMTGQWLFVVAFADMAAYAKAQAALAGSKDMQKNIADNVKVGAALQERVILVGADICRRGQLRPKSQPCRAMAAGLDRPALASTLRAAQ